MNSVILEKKYSSTQHLKCKGKYIKYILLLVCNVIYYNIYNRLILILKIKTYAV